MNLIIPIKKNGEFTEEQRQLAESLIRTDSFPQYYTNSEFKSLVYKGVHLINEDLIIRDGYGSSQSVRAEGLNYQYEKLKSDILENGYRLYEKLIFVKSVSGGKFVLLDGRTKDKILNEKRIKNRICVLIELDDMEIDDYGLRLNSGDDSAPAGLTKEIDIFTLANKHISEDKLDLDYNLILEWINRCCGKGKFSAKKRSDLAYKIFNQQTAIQTSGLLPIAWAPGESASWLKKNNYIETSTVIYLPYAASSPIKAFFAAAELSQQNPGKEVRLVIYVSKLNGYDLKKCYLESILKFKRLWFEYLTKISSTYYGNSKSFDDKVKLYGCVPSNIEDVCEDMTKLIVFGKNDDKITVNYLMNQNLTSFFNLEETEENEEDEEEAYAR